ncbi:MAG TPA: aldose 1-epimerase [Alphaproteobacteria bacterium]|nr:aldose 1-epimerase [Alphaproteobacteria bacterium]
MTSISLVQGPLRLIVDPNHGGVIRRFTLSAESGAPVELMRPMPEGSTDPLESACFPLVPFSNRIGFARFRFDHRDIEMTPNFRPEPHFIHGHGWDTRWDVISAAADRCTIGFRHPGGEWPWAYLATQDFLLTGTALSVRLTLTNLDARPMPAGLGLHPYFPKRPGAGLSAKLDHVWINDDAKLPVERVPLHRGPAPSLETADLDNCFGGWDGAARLHWPLRALTLNIEADPLFGHLVIYVPSGEDHFCVEPVSNANDAFNLAARGVSDTGLRVLERHESLSGTIRFRVA